MSARVRWKRRTRGGRHYEHLGISNGGIVIIFGLILLLIGFVTGVPIVWTIGVIVLVVGLALWLLGSLGHAIGGRHHYY
jgi:fatty-acid desaturase